MEEDLRFQFINVEYIDHMGSDLTVVNAARVSFDKHHNMFDEKGDERLIRYLAKHGHWTPFAHPQIQFRISAPIFIARQLMKHQIGLVWNEVSRRYVDSPPRMFLPTEERGWRKSADNVKQGSSETEFVLDFLDTHSNIDNEVIDHYGNSVSLYKRMLASNICAEQARMVLPLAMFTSWYWTGSLYAFARVCNLRTKMDTQEETRDLAYKLNDIAKQHFPISWRYLTEAILTDDTIRSN